jgi:hypothetical protein
VLNKQYLDENSVTSFGYVPGDPFDPTSESTLTGNTGEFTDIKGVPRRMQFVLRYTF